MEPSDSSPIARWHELVRAKDLGGLDDLLAEDAVFYSPAVHKAQPGKALVAKYLRAAMHVLNNDSFRYVAEWSAPRSAVLEFALELDGVEIDGVDLITWNEDGKIVLFKVMVRPYKALNAVIARMREQLEVPA